MTAVLRLKRPRGGATPAFFRLPNDDEEEIKVGRNGDDCDVFLYVDEHPSFLSRVHARFRCVRASAEEKLPDAGKCVEQGVDGPGADGAGSVAKSLVAYHFDLIKDTFVKADTSSTSEQPAESSSSQEPATNSGTTSQKASGEISAHQAQLVSRARAQDNDVLAEKSPSTDVTWEVIDNNSVNGVFVNGTRLQGNTPKALVKGDRIFFGNPQHSFFLEYEFVVFSKGTKEALFYEKSSNRNLAKKQRKPPKTVKQPSGLTADEDDFLRNIFLQQQTGQTPLSPAALKKLEDINDALAKGRVLTREKTIPQQDLPATKGERKDSPPPRDEKVKGTGAGSASSSSSAAGVGSSLASSVQRLIMSSSSSKSKAVDAASLTSDDRTMMDDEEDFDFPRVSDHESTCTGSRPLRRKRTGSRLCGPNKQSFALRKKLSHFHQLVRADIWSEILPFLELLEVFKLREVSTLVESANNRYLSKVRSIRFSHHMVKSITQEMLTRCSGVRKINASGCYNISDKEVDIIAKYAPQVECLDLSGCSKIATEAIKALSKRCRDIKSLRLRACKRIAVARSTEFLKELAKNNPNLEHLDLRCCNMEDGALINLLKVCPSLKSLDIGSTGFANVSDLVLLELASNPNSKLESLGVMCCRSITDDGVAAVAKNCGKTLRHFTLHCCFELTDRSLTSLARHCKVLESLNVHRCLKVTDDGIE